MSNLPVKRIALSGLFAAISIAILFAVPRFPLFLPFLEYDFADVPIIMLTMLYGPVYGLMVTGIVCVIQGFLLSSSGYLGVIMHIVATGSYVITFGLLYRKFRSTKGLIFSAIMGVLVWTGIMIPFNIFITPIFMGAPRSAVYAILLPAILPFNLIKSTGNSIIAITLFFTLNRFMKNALVREQTLHLKKIRQK